MTYKVLVASDIHIDAYVPASTILNDGVPDRLLNFDTLAEKIVRKAEKVDAIIIAGDLANSATNRAMVSNMISLFLAKLADVAPVYLIHGNHDWDGKGFSPDLQNSSVLWQYNNMPNVHYLDNEIDDLGGYQVLFRGWRDNFKIPKIAKNADVLVSHGFVKTAKLPTGRRVDVGFDPKEMSERFKFSVFGDIHKRQLLYGNVLIPGCPIQASFKDHWSNGVWIIEDWEHPRFIRLDDPKFHKFIRVSSEDKLTDRMIGERGPGTLHVKIIGDTKEQLGDETTGEAVVSPIVSTKQALSLTIKQVLPDHTPAERKEVKRLALKLIEECKNKVTLNTSNKSLRITELRISNFRSIVDMYLDFREIRDPVLILGDSGSGKTSIFEAIGFALFDTITNKSTASEVVCDFSTGDTCVSVGLGEHSKTEYLVVKTVSNGSTSRSIEKIGEHPKTFAARDWETFITNLTSVTKGEYRELLYYSQSSQMLVGNLSPTTQSLLFGRVCGLEGILEAHKRAKELASTWNDKASGYYGAVQALEDREDGATRRKKLWKKLKPYSGVDLFTAFCPKEYKGKFSGISQMKQVETEQRRAIDKIAASIDKLEENLEECKGGKCPTCNQRIAGDKSLKVKIMEELEVLRADKRKLEVKAQKLPSEDEIQTLEAKISEYKYMDKEYQELKKEREKSKGNIEEKKKLYDEAVASVELYRDVAHVLSPSGIYPILLESLVSSINESLEEMLSSTGIKIKLSSFRYSGKGSMAPGIEIKASFFGATFRKYHPLSEGQKRFVDLCLIIVLNNLKIANGCLSLLALDEIFVYAGTNIIEQALAVLEHSKAKQRFVVTHDFNVEKAFANRLTLKLDKNKGTVIASQEVSEKSKRKTRVTNR